MALATVSLLSDFASEKALIVWMTTFTRSIQDGRIVDSTIATRHSTQCGGAAAMPCPSCATPSRLDDSAARSPLCLQSVVSMLDDISPETVIPSRQSVQIGIYAPTSDIVSAHSTSFLAFNRNRRGFTMPKIPFIRICSPLPGGANSISTSLSQTRSLSIPNSLTS
jgi:hypothetical protein